MISSPLDDNPNYQIYQLARLFTQCFTISTRAVAKRIYPEQWIILNRLVGQSPLSQTDLVPRLAAGQAALTRTLITMEKRGWIRRKRDKTDGRRVSIELTPKGRNIYEQIAALSKDIRQIMFEGISTQAMSSFVRTLKKFEGNTVRAIEFARQQSSERKQNLH